MRQSGFMEMAAQYPIAGSVYQWSKQLSSGFTSWMTGWIYIVGAIVTIAAVAVEIAETQIPAAPPRYLPAAVYALGRAVEPQLQQQPRMVRVLPQRRVPRLERAQLQLLDRLVDEEDGITALEGVIHKRRQQLPLPLPVRLPPLPLRHATRLARRAGRSLGSAS